MKETLMLVAALGVVGAGLWWVARRERQQAKKRTPARSYITSRPMTPAPEGSGTAPPSRPAASPSQDTRLATNEAYEPYSPVHYAHLYCPPPTDNYPPPAPPAPEPPSAPPPVDTDYSGTGGSFDSGSSDSGGSSDCGGGDCGGGGD